MLNEGTSILASFNVSVRLMEGKHESPIKSLYGLKTLFCVTDMIVQSLRACQNMHYTCWNEDLKDFILFSRNVRCALACAWRNPDLFFKGLSKYNNPICFGWSIQWDTDFYLNQELVAWPCLFNNHSIGLLVYL